MSPNEILILVVAAAAALAALAMLLRRRRQRREPPQPTRTCVTCDNLGESELCDECGGAGLHWVARPPREIDSK